VTGEHAGRGADPVPGTGCLLAGSIESPELISSLALRLPASWVEALGPPPCAVLRLPTDTAVFFCLDARADLRSLRSAGETYNKTIVFIKANLSCFSMTPRQEALLTHNRHSATASVGSQLRQSQPASIRNHNSLLAWTGFLLVAQVNSLQPQCSSNHSTRLPNADSIYMINDRPFGAPASETTSAGHAYQLRHLSNGEAK
jgi:hypothetical protein